MKRNSVIVLITAMIITSMAVPQVYSAEAVIGQTPDNPVVVNYEEDVDPDVYDGVWVSTDLGFDLYLPEDWIEAELTDEMEKAGVIHLYGEEEGGANIVITCTELPEEVAETYDFDQLGTELAQTNTTAMYMDLNGILAVVFDNEETYISGFSTLTSDGYLITGVISAPEDDMYEEFSPYFRNIIMSVSLTEEEEAETE